MFYTEVVDSIPGKDVDKLSRYQVNSTLLLKDQNNFVIFKKLCQCTGIQDNH